MVALRFERGLGYLVRGAPREAPSLVGQLGAEARPCLWVTALASAPLPPGGDVLRVTSLTDASGGLDPRHLTDLRAAWATFLEAHPGGCLVLDCLDVFVLHHGVERVVRAVGTLHDDTASQGGNLVVFADPATANPRLLAWLERELDAPLVAPAAAGPLLL